jgi:hypothetical protein
MNMLKINNKFKYISKKKNPILNDFQDEVKYNIAKQIFELDKSSNGLISINVINKDFKLKSTIKRIKRFELKIGNIVFIERWDGNGIPDEVRIISIKKSISRAIIKTDKGFFIFSKWNCKKDNILFNWTCKGKEWQKNHMKWIDGDKYYLNIA